MKSENINLKNYNLDNLNKLAQKTWVYDYGFNKTCDTAEAPDGSKQGQLKQEKTGKSLWKLLTEESNTTQEALKYLDLPPDIPDFIDWVRNDVTRPVFYNTDRPSMKTMPYKKLYKIWREYAYLQERQESEQEQEPQQKPEKQRNKKKQ